MKKSAFLIIGMLCLNLFGQNEASNWYFGYGAGLKFNLNNNATIALEDGNLNTTEGCATISDELGNLLFYTDGITVWNKNHDTMLNGRRLLGDPSSTQSAIIVPKPNDKNIYYIFTVDDYSFNQIHFGLNYSTVDMTLDEGLGGITSKNVNLLNQCAEKVTAVVKDCPDGSIWVMTLSSLNGNSDIFDTFHAFEVSESGVSPRSVKSTFDLAINDERGYLKLSPDGNKMACANMTNGLYIYDFDASSGKVNNQKRLSIQGPNNRPYGLEFSPNGQLLYVVSSNDFFDIENPISSADPTNHRSLLIQFNLLDPDIQTSRTIIDDRQLYRGALQLGPNGKIYRALSETYEEGINALGAINNPNQIGLDCNYKHNAINLGQNQSAQGLPPFIASFFSKKIDIIKNGKDSRSLGLCAGDSFQLSADVFTNATYSWYRNKEILSETSSNLDISESGYYEVYINPNNGDCLIEGEALVTFSEHPEVFNTEFFQCDDDNDGKTVFNLAESYQLLTTNIQNKTFEFFENMERTRIIPNSSYSNKTNPQTLYVNVIDNASGCFSTTQLTLSVSTTSIKDVRFAVCDDDGIEDGIYNFNLNDLKNEIVSELPTDVTIAFYKSFNNALLEDSELNTSYRNIIPYNETIFVRAENNNSCFGIAEINLTVNRLPEGPSNENVIYCLNKFPEPITIGVGIDSLDRNNYSYNWSTGETTPEIQVNETGAYTVAIINKLGCSKTQTITVTPSNLALIESIKIEDASKNNTISVVTSGEGVYEYGLLDNNNKEVYPFQYNPVFSNVIPGIYNVLVNDVKNNCGSVSTKVSVIGFPKFFTPNNDGYHDTWQVYGVSEMFQPGTKIQIFNRFGKLIKEITPLGKGWDGSFKGVKLPSDDYWFLVRLQDGRIFKDHFALIN